MRFTCDGCGKRYATADEPVPGRVYKLTCKRCGHVIVLRVPAAVVGPAAAARPDATGGGALAPAPPPAQMPGPGSERAAWSEPPAPPQGDVPGAFEPELDEPPRRPDAAAANAGALTPPPGSVDRAPPPVAAQPVTPPDLDLPPLLPEEPEEPASPAAQAPTTAVEEEVTVPDSAPAQRPFELSRMSRARSGLPLPVILVGLLIVVAVVVALLRAERPRTPAARPAATAPAR